jgi:hypothetical protein
MTIYSTRFAEGVMTSTGPQLVYTVPLGRVAVLRCVDGFGSGLGSSALSIGLNGNPPCILLGGTTITDPEGGVHWDGYQVLNQADTLELYSNFVGQRFILSGYLLLLP